jgi:hypothetical protein
LEQKKRVFDLAGMGNTLFPMPGGALTKLNSISYANEFSRSRDSISTLMSYRSTPPVSVTPDIVVVAQAESSEESLSLNPPSRLTSSSVDDSSHDFVIGLCGTVDSNDNSPHCGPPVATSNDDDTDDVLRTPVVVRTFTVDDGEIPGLNMSAASPADQNRGGSGSSSSVSFAVDGSTHDLLRSSPFAGFQTSSNNKYAYSPLRLARNVSYSGFTNSFDSNPADLHAEPTTLWKLSSEFDNLFRLFADRAVLNVVSRALRTNSF